MDKEGLSRLIVTLMTAGDMDELDLRDLRRVHSAVLEVVRTPGGERLAARLGAHVSATPDAAVGMRVGGLTQAMWGAVSAGWLRAVQADTFCGYLLAPEAATSFAAIVRQLPPEERVAVDQAGEAWAAALISRKNLANAFASPAAT